MSESILPENVDYEEGLYYERVFGPTKIELRVDSEDPKNRAKWSVVLVDANGETLELKDRHAVRRMMEKLFYPLKSKGIVEKFKELTNSDKEKLQGLLNQSLDLKPKDFKFLYDDAGEIVGVVSPTHKQISWKEIRESVEKAVAEVYGFVESSNGLRNAWSYKMPVENKFVNVWAHVDAGNNRAKGRSSIRISTRLQTIFDTRSDGVRAPCMNWAHLWTEPLRLFNIPATRITSTRTITVGTEDLPLPTFVGTHDIHVKGTDIDFDALKRSLAQLKESTESVVLKEYIETSIKEPLGFFEARDILDAYNASKGDQGSANIPAYVREAILDKFSREDETVWGFSQAVSWVRTHGGLKGKKPREERGLTRKLENIAGEILSLAPTIRDFHAKVGDVTFERLIGKTRSELEETQVPEITVKNEGILRE